MPIKFGRGSMWMALGFAALSLAKPVCCQFAYVANTYSANISGYKMHPNTGVLTAVPGSPFATPQPTSMAVDPQGRFVYAGDQKISGYKINQTTGTLTAIHGSPFAIAGTSEAIAIDPSGQFLYVASTSFISAFKINPTSGALSPIAGSPFNSGIVPQSLAMAPSGKFLYAGDPSGRVGGFAINANGALTAIPGSPFVTSLGASPLYLGIDPLDRFLYAAAYDNNRIVGFNIDATTGVLTLIGNYLAFEPTSVTVDPSGNYVYAASVDGIYGYSIAPRSSFLPPSTFINAGDLSPLAGSPFGTEAPEPNSVAVDYTGTFAYATHLNLAMSQVSAYKISGGALTPLAKSPFQAGAGPLSISLVRPPATPLYSVTEISFPQVIIGTLGSFVPAAINDKGQVTGTFSSSSGNEPFTYPFLYSDGITNGLGALNGARFATGNGINNSGEVVGVSAVSVPISPMAPDQAVLYNNGNITDIDTVINRQSDAAGINNAGQITGSLSTGTCILFGIGASSCGNTHAFLYSAGAMVDLGTLGGDYSTGSGINAQGHITGSSNLVANGATHAFLYKQGAFKDLGTLAGFATTGVGINNDDEIIGYATNPTTGNLIGFLWNGSMTRLPTLGGASSQPLGINNLGVIVGTSSVGSGGPNHALLYIAGQAVDLNTLVDPTLPLLTTAIDINKSGQIVATGLDGLSYILTPK